VQDSNTPITNAGKFSLGALGVLSLSPGSSFAQSSGGEFVTNIDVPGATSGRIQGAGASPLSLNGKFTVNTVGTPATGSNRTVIAGTARAGTFTSYNMNGQPYSVLYPADGVVLHTEPLLVITTTSPLPAATPGVAYSKTLVATGGIPPRGWSLASGTLPTGLSLSAGGVISGTTTKPGTYTFSAKVTDAGSPPQSKTKQFVLTVNPWCPASVFPTSVKGSNVATAGQPTGIYIWVSPDGVWHLVSTRTGTGTQTFTGTVTTTGTFRQPTAYKLENQPGNVDTFALNAATTQITFSFQTANDVDGITFVSSCSGTVTFDLQQNAAPLATSKIFLGGEPHTNPTTNPFDIVLLPAAAPLATRYP
jgi:hypothetical protein